MISIRKLINDYHEPIMYIVFGLGATLINIVSYMALVDIAHVNYVISNILAWVLAFIFAFFTNKFWVFESKSWEVHTFVSEFIGFFAARAFTGILDTVSMVVCVSVLLMPDLLSKILVNVIVIIVNYVASKYVIFKGDKS